MTATTRKRSPKAAVRAPPVGHSSGLFDQLDAESSLATRLELFGVIFDGDTTPAIRAERARVAIAEARLAMVIAGRTLSGKPETFSDLYQRIYGQKL